MVFVYAAIYIVVLLLFATLIRKSVWGAFGLALVALATAPLWPEHLDGWFRWVKTLSVLVPMAFLIGLARIAHHDQRGGAWKFMRGEWVLWGFYAMFALNIAEASVKDIALGNTLNGAAGFVLMILLPAVRYPGFKQRNWGFADDNKGDVFALTGTAWNIAYVSWNLLFVYNENPTYFASSAALLIAALLYTFLVNKPELFGMIRVFTLAFHLTLRAATDVMPQTLDQYPAVPNETVATVWAIVNFVAMISLLAWRLFSVNASRKDKAAVPSEESSPISAPQGQNPAVDARG
ncbi:MAG: hypothetical protein AAFW65_07725 [Pseudomonadota bacterium]